MKNIEKMYAEPKVELVGISATDIIQTSGPIPGPTGPTTHWVTTTWNASWGE